MLPVDVCAEASVRLFFDERAVAPVYNLTHGNPDADQEFVNVAKRFGHNVELVEFEEFAKRVQDAGDDERGNSALSTFKKMRS